MCVCVCALKISAMTLSQNRWQRPWDPPQGPLEVPGALSAIVALLCLRAAPHRLERRVCARAHTHACTHPRLPRNGSRLVHQPVSLYSPLCCCCCSGCWCVCVCESGLGDCEATRTTATMMTRMKTTQPRTHDRPPCQISPGVVVSARIFNNFGAQ